ASKVARAGFATAARQELSAFGVRISVVEHGSIATGIGLRRTKYLDEGSVYATDVSTMLEHLDRNERDGIAPETVAATIVDAVTWPKPPALNAAGSPAPQPDAYTNAPPGGTTSTKCGDAAADD